MSVSALFRATSRIGAQASNRLMTRSFAVRALNDAEAVSKTLAETKPVVIDFYATWCMPCKMFAPKYSALSEQFPDVVFAKIDVDEVDVSNFSQLPEISSVPTFAVLKDGKVVTTFSGASEARLVDAIKKLSQ